jgi:hypothetical protein
MSEQITVTCKPKQLVYRNGNYNLTSKSWDNNTDTYDSIDNGAGGRPATLLLNLSAVPGNAVIKKVRYRLLLYRTGNASYCALQAALGYADSLTNNISAQHRVTDYKDIGLSAYKVKEETSAEQSITSAQSAQILNAQYPIVWMNGYGTMRYFEIYVDVTYEIPVGEIYVGDQQATEVYVGTKKASAVYVGTKKVL